ncbi:MAG: exonuclease SbcCD subunit D [Dehalococcoidia bacterium]|nr:exonuclease SbcCD subunit D [Dehalococcoidia bacterium]
MRILHFSDLHIGVESYGHIDPQTGLSARLADFLRTYDQLLDFAIREQVDLVLFCGDAYKSRDPSQTHQRAFARGITRLAQAGIPAFLVVGNHDLPATRGRATALDIFPTLRTPGVIVADRVQPYTVETRSGPLQIVALPWIRRAEFATHPDAASGRSVEEVNRFIERRLGEFVHAAAEALDPRLPAILAGHCTVSGAVTSSEQSMMLGRDHVLLQSSLSLPSFDYVALGHIHKRQVLGVNPPIVYSGSLERVDFGEEKDQKGFYLVELDPTQPRGQRLKAYTFEPVAARAFLTIPVSIDQDDPDPTETVLAAIRRHQVADKVVRVEVTIPRHLEPSLNERRIREALEGAFYIAPLERHLLGDRRTRWQGEALESAKPLDALARYLDTRQGVSPERKRLLLERARDLLEDEPP